MGNVIGTLLSILCGNIGRLRGSTEAEEDVEPLTPSPSSPVEDVEPLTPSPSSPATGRSEFDVFLSFRGEDTRKGFTGHLYDDLAERGVSTFIDSKKLEKGEEIGKLFEYIERSKIFLPIFSERYAESKWCLKEVTKSVECRQEIVPVFFGVEPSDVRNQRGPFESAFRKHESNKKLDQEEVRKWKEALKKVANISGFNLKEMNGDEAKLRRAVIKRVLEKVNKKPLQVAKHPIGIESRSQEVKKMLENGGNVNGVQVVGIHGMGGLGKTTIAKAVYNDLAERFNGATCFLSNVRENAGQPDGLVKLQKKFFHEILKDGNIFLSDVAHGVSLIKERARDKRLLLVLDDVDSVAQLDALAGGRDCFGSGSVIIITTRDEQVLLAYSLKQDEIYKPEVLNQQQSWELFLLHAFNGEEPEGEYLRLSNEIVAEAGGLPLTIEVLGSLLTPVMDVEQWQNTLDRLKKIPPTKVQQRLKLSYDSLDQPEQKIFLDISCFFLHLGFLLCGEEYARYMWEDCGWSPKYAIKVLEQRSLLKIDWGYKRFEMHDQIRDMGRAIVEEECSRRLEKQSRLWNSQDSLALLRRKVPGTIDAEGIEIWPDEKYCVSAKCFENMPNLRYLNASDLNFQGTFRCFPRSLKWLQLQNCHFDKIPSNFNLEKAVVLNLRNTNIVKVFIKQLRLNLKAFEKLKGLSIDDVEINVLPNLSNIPNLQRLAVRCCSKLATIDESIGKLKNLRNLCISDIEKLGKLPDSIGELSSLQRLVITKTSVAKIPDSICHLSSLKIFELAYCRSLTSLPERLGDMRSLEKLLLSHIRIIEVPDSIGQLTNLCVLHMTYCQRLSRLPDSICQLSSLEILDLEGCWQLTSLPERLGDMRSLEKLSLSHVSISEMPDSISQLTNLHELIMASCFCLSKFPESICRLSSLEVLDLNYCISLPSRYVGECIGDMVSLKELDLSWTAIGVIPDAICQLSLLKSIKLRGLYNRCTLPERLGDMEQLEELILDDTGKDLTFPWDP